MKDPNSMFKIKVLFLLLIITFSSTIVVGQYYYEKNTPLLKSISMEVTQNITESIFGKGIVEYTNSTTCDSSERKIILRMDDVRAYSIPTPYLVDEVLSRDLSITLGVIPNNLEKDQKMQEYLLKIRKNQNIEIAQHGNYHDASDRSISEENLLDGNKKIQEVLKVIPVTYIPPYNKIEDNAVLTVSKYFKIISSKPGVLKRENGLLEVGGDVETYRYDTKKYVLTNEIVSQCKDSLDKTNLCVIIIHPQEYSTDINNPTDISQERLQEFNNMLDELEKLNAEFETFNEFSQCATI